MGDWVLGNGFYRPLPSVLYQLDYWLWGANLLAWKWTNGLIAVLNALMVVAFGWVLSGRRDMALAGGLTFTVWQTGLLLEPPLGLGWVGLGMGALWGWRVGDLRRGLLWGCVAFAFIVEMRFIPTLPDIHLQSFAYRAMGWIPGRTATLMTLFALLALIGTCLYARTSRLRWAVLGTTGFVGALLSYEQAVALPILMGFCALSVSRKHGKRGLSVPFKAVILPLLCLLLLVPYFVFYRTNIPINTQYHQQRVKRFRALPETTFYWLIPTGREALAQIDVACTAPFNLLMPSFWVGLFRVSAHKYAPLFECRTLKLVAVQSPPGGVAGMNPNAIQLGWLLRMVAVAV
jgi:hypothetical protein